MLLLDGVAVSVRDKCCDGTTSAGGVYGNTCVVLVVLLCWVTTGELTLVSPKFSGSAPEGIMLGGEGVPVDGRM